MSFLRAEWRKLALANYSIDKSVLEKYIPAGTELDLWNDTCYVSLVGFMFVNTKLLRIKIPFHINFEEVNLRFYVKRCENGEWKRGVVFTKEIVPKAAITFVANTIYKENYETLKMRHNWLINKDQLEVEYAWRKNKSWNSFQVSAKNELIDLQNGSEAEFITEHYWGYAKSGENKTNEYEVTHPRWQIYQEIDYSINVDFGLVYGKEFEFLTNQKPTSVMLAEGSLITVENKRKIVVE